MKRISLTQGQVALVDDADYDELSKVNWYFDNGYAARKIPNLKGGQSTLLMHQVLLPEAIEIDHRDGHRANNQRYNLRAVTHTQNLQSKCKKAPGCSSRFRGVCRHNSGSWQAQIRVLGKVIYLGLFKDENSAARCYDAAARKYFGEFASPNFG